MREKIKEFFINTNLVPDNLKNEFNDDLNLIDNGIIESFNIISLVIFIENNFNIKFSSRDMSATNFKTIKTIEELILRKIKERDE